MTAVQEMPALRDRLGPAFVAQRTALEQYQPPREFGVWMMIFHPRYLPILRWMMWFTLKCLGLYGRGVRNAHTLQTQENRVAIRGLPAAFAGFRILHLSDLHLDIQPTITDALIRHLQGLQYDCCVITGDFREGLWTAPDQALAETARLMPHLREPVYVVPGNHDSLEMAEALERMGMRVLINEHIILNRGGASICLAGLDDTHYYRTHDLTAALRGVPEDMPVVMLAHSGEVYRDAAARGVDLLLCGHTHGGQICLPGGFALMHHVEHPRAMSRGAWRFGALQGYTSSGVGASILPVRFFCPPQVVIHILEKSEDSS